MFLFTLVYPQNQKAVSSVYWICSDVIIISRWGNVMNYFTSISLSCQTIYFDRSVFTCITIPILFSFFNKCISIMIRKNMGCPLKYSDLSRNAVNMVHFRLHDGWFALQIRCHVVLWLHWWHFFDICLILWT